MTGESLAEQKLRKRYASARRRLGACAFCQFRERTGAVFHCRKLPDRQRGMCHDDGKLPQFRLDDSTLEVLRDDAR